MVMRRGFVQIDTRTVNDPDARLQARRAQGGFGEKESALD